jgi:glycine/D-amino acid oxidase-like deaminating enzyme
VSDIRRNGRGFSARVGGRQIDAEQVLVATNGYTGKELPFFRRRIIPARSAIIATEELPGDVAASLSPKGRGLGDSSRLLVYMRMSSDNRRLIFGGRNFKLEDRPDIYVPDLRRLALRIFPQLGNFRVSHGWSGTVGFTFDYAPHIGQHDGVHYVMGFCGSGVGRASYYGRMTALQMAGDPA